MAAEVFYNQSQDMLIDFKTPHICMSKSQNMEALQV
jgi:hypothetical protein